MDQVAKRRGLLTAIGAGAALALYGLWRLAEAGVLADRPLLMLVILTGSFFYAMLAMIGPLTITRAAQGAGLIGVGLAVLALIHSLRFDTIDGALGATQPYFAGFALMNLPLPFWIAHSRGNWQDYPTLFGEAWAIVVRGVVASVFTGVVWLVIWLSDMLLSLVGIGIIGTLIESEPVPFLITGAAFGLALAVVLELAEVLGPNLLLRLLRLLLLPLLVVVAVFILALPFRGLTELFNAFSAGAILLVILAAGATLITAVVDQTEEGASQSPVLVMAARAFAVLLPVIAVLAVAALALRVSQYGWTPERVVAAQVAALGLGYGGFYLWAGLRGAGWMARIRRGNVVMALAIMGLAALSLTPVIHAEWISARSQVARYDAGLTKPEAMDTYALSQWGKAGAAALAELRVKAEAAGQTALIASIDDPTPAYLETDNPNAEEEKAELRAKLAEAMPLQPATATATRDMLMDSLQDYELRNILDACEVPLGSGTGPSCVMVIVDLLPDEPGEEGVILTQRDGYAEYIPLVAGKDRWQVGATLSVPLPDAGRMEEIIAQWQAAPPPVSPARINQIPLGDGMMILLPQ